MTEDETVKKLMKYLRTEGWVIKSYCLGQQRGFDIVAERQKEQLIIEVKGAKASDNSPTKKRDFFNSGQIKVHLGKAIVKAFETQNEFPKAKVAIAHPETAYLKKVIGKLIQNINDAGIVHFWVNEDGSVKMN